MSPKAKSDQVITHRIEFQETERDALEMVAASITAKNVTASVENLTKGVGNLLTPILSASVAGVAAGLGLLAWYESEGVAAKDSAQKRRADAYFESGGHSENESNEQAKHEQTTNFLMKLNQLRNAISTELMKVSNKEYI